MYDSKLHNKYLASYAIFCELYNSGKSDIFLIIAEFIKEIISERAKYAFELNEIEKILRETYSFNIPSSVVRTSLKKIDGVKRANGKYHVSDLKLINSEIDKVKKEEIISNNEEIIEKLMEYMEQILCHEEVVRNKNKILESFSAFLLKDSNGYDYSDIISAFIVKNKGNKEFSNQLNCIKEGVVIFQGLNYDSTPNTAKSLKNKMIIFLETEILFHLAGFNGTVFQEMVRQLFDIIEEINNANKESKIQLRFFKETEKEIDIFFRSAEHIISNTKNLKYSNTAMMSIIDGCKETSEIAAKRTDFYQMLKKNKIFLDDFEEYYIEKNNKFNLEGMKFDDYEYDDEKNINYLKLLSHVNVRRKGNKPYKIQDVKYVLLSENRKVRKLAIEINEQDSENYIPLALGLSTLTNKFWVQLNKGLGARTFPKAFDIITKAQIVLSKHLTNSVVEKFEKLNKMNLEDYEKENILARLIDLRNQIKKPEEIIEEEVEDVLHNISNEDYEEFIEKNQLEVEEAKKTKIERDKLICEVSDYERELQEKNKLLKKSNSTNIKIIIQHLEDTKKSLNRLNESKENADKEVVRKVKLIKIGMIVLPIIVFIFSVILIKIIGWDIIEPYTWLLSFLASSVTIIYQLIKEREIKISKIMEKKKDQVKDKIYMKYSVVEEEILHLKNLKEELEENLDKVE